MIPKVLHQMWLDAKVDHNDGPPARYVRLGYPRRFQELNPDFLYYFWNNARVNELFREEPYAEYYEFYRNLQHLIERCDFARLVVLHKYGGFYFDLDVEPHQPIPEEHRRREVLLVREPVEHTSYPPVDDLLCNGILASTPGHPFWIELMEYIRRHYQRGGSDRVLPNTGPVALTRFVNEYYPSLQVELTINFACHYFPRTKTGQVSKACQGIDPITIVQMDEGSRWGYDFSYERQGDVLVERPPAVGYIVGVSVSSFVAGLLLIAVVVLAVKLSQAKGERAGE